MHYFNKVGLFSVIILPPLRAKLLIVAVSSIINSVCQARSLGLTYYIRPTYGRPRPCLVGLVDLVG